MDPKENHNILIISIVAIVAIVTVFAILSYSIKNASGMAAMSVSAQHEETEPPTVVTQSFGECLVDTYNDCYNGCEGYDDCYDANDNSIPCDCDDLATGCWQSSAQYCISVYYPNAR